MTAKPEDCADYGKDWDPNHVMCAGGLDPSYINPVNGSNQREKCRWFSQCAQRTSLHKLGQRTPQVAVTAPKPPPPPPQPQPWTPLHALAHGTMQGQQMTRHQAVQVKPTPQPVVAVQQQGYPSPLAPPAMAGAPYMVPMNYAAYGAQMPAYLTIPEPVLPGQHWGSRLAYTLIRSMMKAAGHSTANFFDHMTFTPYPVYPPPDETDQT